MCTRACGQVSEDRSQQGVFAAMLTTFVLLQHKLFQKEGFLATIHKLCMIAPISVFCVNHQFLATCMCSSETHVLAFVLQH
jgi:hypothetical protein